MEGRDIIRPQAPPRTPADRTVDFYVIALSVVMLLFGLRHWAVIVGVVPGATGSFETMTTPWRLATMHMAVVDPVAAVGLWMRVAWGKVIWLYAALAEIAMHAIFYGTFGFNWALVAFHAVTVAVFIALTIWARVSVPR
jgi:hypothetical protein